MGRGRNGGPSRRLAVHSIKKPEVYSFSHALAVKSLRPAAVAVPSLPVSKSNSKDAFYAGFCMRGASCELFCKWAHKKRPGDGSSWDTAAGLRKCRRESIREGAVHILPQGTCEQV